MTVKIDNVEYKADEAVVNRMNEYVAIIEKARTTYKNLRDKGIDMRKLQKEYFRGKDTRVLEKSKAAEREFDDLLINKPKVHQPTLL